MTCGGIASNMAPLNIRSNAVNLLPGFGPIVTGAPVKAAWSLGFMYIE